MYMPVCPHCFLLTKLCTVAILRCVVKMLHVIYFMHNNIIQSINTMFMLRKVLHNFVCMNLLYLQADTDVVVGGSDDGGMFVFDGLVLMSGLEVFTCSTLLHVIYIYIHADMLMPEGVHQLTPKKIYLVFPHLTTTGRPLLGSVAKW